jgi:hypothetical protein
MAVFHVTLNIFPIVLQYTVVTDITLHQKLIHDKITNYYIYKSYSLLNRGYENFSKNMYGSYCILKFLAKKEYYP